MLVPQVNNKVLKLRVCFQDNQELAFSHANKGQRALQKAEVNYVSHLLSEG